jgi:hypothetical protein
MASLHVSGSDGAVALLVAEAISGYWLEKRRKEPWTAWKVVLAGLLVACIAVEVDLAIVREHAAVKDREAQAMETVRRQTAHVHAAPPPAPTVQVERIGPHAMHAAGDAQVQAMKAQAAIAKEQEERTEKRAQEAARRAGQADPWEMAGQVGMAVVYSVATAVAAAAVGESMDSLRVVLERVFGAPAVLRPSCPALAGDAAGIDEVLASRAPEGGRVPTLNAIDTTRSAQLCHAVSSPPS